MARLAKEGGIILSIGAVLILLTGIFFLYMYGRVGRSVFVERYFVLGSLNVAVGVVGLIGGINAIKKRSYYVSIGCGVVPLIFIVLTLLFLEFPLLNLWSLIFWTVGLNLIAFSSEDFKKNS